MPTAEDRERNMENAIQAAINCFETVGISNCTREMIAEKSGLSTRSIKTMRPERRGQSYENAGN